MSTPLKASIYTQTNFSDVLSPCDEGFKTVRGSSFSKRFFEFTTGSRFVSKSLLYSSFIGLRRPVGHFFGFVPPPPAPGHSEANARKKTRL
jgi:hypothetical protein